MTYDSRDELYYEAELSDGGVGVDVRGLLGVGWARQTGLR